MASDDPFKVSFGLFLEELTLLKKVLWKSKNPHHGSVSYKRLVEVKRYCNIFKEKYREYQEFISKKTISTQIHVKQQQSTFFVQFFDKFIAVIKNAYRYVKLLMSLSQLLPFCLTSACILARLHSLMEYFKSTIPQLYRQAMNTPRDFILKKHATDMMNEGDEETGVPVCLGIDGQSKVPNPWKGCEDSMNSIKNINENDALKKKRKKIIHKALPSCSTESISDAQRKKSLHKKKRKKTSNKHKDEIDNIFSML